MARKVESNIVIHQPVLLDAAKLNPAPYNPRKIKPEMLQALKTSIRTRGFIDPIVVQKKGLVVIGGHQRLKAMQELSGEMGKPMPKLPCIVLDVNDREAKKLNVTLNRVGGEFDASMLGDLLRSLQDETQLTGDELLGMGIGGDEFESLLKVDAPLGSDEEIPTFAKTVTLSLSFEDVKMRDNVKKKLEKRAKLEGKKSGVVVNDLLRAR